MRKRECAKRAPKRRRVKCARRERAADTSTSAKPLASLPAPYSVRTPESSPPRSGSPSIPTTAASPSSPPSHQRAALCKSPHMLPRVPVSQRHSRVLFRTLVTRYGSPGGQEGAIKRSFSLSLSLTTSRRTEDTVGERDTHVTPRNTARTGTAERGGGGPVCVLALSARVYVTCTRARAASSLFSASRGAAATSSSNRHVRPKAEEQLIGWSDRRRGGEEQSAAVSVPTQRPASAHTLPFSPHFYLSFPPHSPPFFTFVRTRRLILGAPRRVCNLLEREVLAHD